MILNLSLAGANTVLTALFGGATLVIKYSKKCNVCKAIKQNKKIGQDIFNTKFYISTNIKTLTDIAQEYHEFFSYDSLKNHVKRHQFMDKEDFNKRSMKMIADRQQNIVKAEDIKNQDVKDIWNRVIQQGIQDMEDGKVVIKPADLLKAAKDKSDYELKVKDQQMAYAEMMWHFASGESNESKNYDRRIIEGQTADYYDPTEGTTGDSGAGQDRPSDIHNSIAWNALTQGADTLPKENNS